MAKSKRSRQRARGKARNPSQKTITKESRLQRSSKSLDSTLAIETVRKMVDLLKPWELSPSHKYKTYQLMLRNPDVYSAVESRITGIESAQALPRLVYDKNSERSAFLKDLVEYNIKSMQGTSRSIGREAAEMVVNGVAPFEVSFRREAKYQDYLGYRVLDKINYIDPLTIDSARPFITKGGGQELIFLNQRKDAFKDTIGVRNRVQVGVSGSVEIDMRKVAMVSYGSTASKPFGTSPLDAVYDTWREIDLVNNLLLVGIQKDLAGTPVLRVPQDLFDQAADPNSDAARTIEQLKSHMASLHAGDQTYMILPSDGFAENGTGNLMYDVSFKGIDGRNKSFELVDILEQKKKTIYTALGAAHLITGENGGGSYNLLEGKANIQAHYSKRDNLLIDEMWNERIIPLILEMNDLTNEKISDIPVYKHGNVQPLSADEKGKFFMRTQRAMPIVPDVVNGLLETMDIDYRVPENTSTEELLQMCALSGIEVNNGESEGTSGTGNSQAEVTNSDTNGENAA